LDRRRLFGWIGVAGVVAAVVGVFELFFHSGHGVVLVPAAVLLAIAAIGGTLARVRGERADRRPLRGAAVALLTCTAVTVVLAYAYTTQQHGTCDMPTVHNFWTGVTGWGAVFTAACAVVLGLAVLAGRRWFVALIGVFVNPTALLWLVASTSAFC
jgi:hypothetical protein